MDTCHECEVIVDKLNQEFSDLLYKYDLLLIEFHKDKSYKKTKKDLLLLMQERGLEILHLASEDNLSKY